MRVDRIEVLACRSVLASAALLLLPAGLHAQRVEAGAVAPAAVAPTGPYDHALAPMGQAIRLTGSISIDGTLDEPQWQSAPAITDLIQTVPIEGQPVSERTEVRFAYDDEAIYVAARLDDRSPVTTRLARRDAGLGDSDQFVVMLDSYHDHETAYRFWTNPSGVKGDQIVTGNNTGGGDSSWDPVWDLATAVTAEGWTVEMRIPFSQLRFSPAAQQVWGFQVERQINRNQEQAAFPFTPVLERSGVSRFAHVEGIEGIEPGRRLELLPYFVARGEYLQLDEPISPELENPYRSGSDHFGDAGFDLKYRITSNVTLDGTVNPDFGQVELDPSEINLTAFETQFSERRPFFVEGADIFTFGEAGPTGSVGRGPDLLYSRRIGAAPRGDLPGDAAYADAPAQTTILGAAKITGRLPGGWSLGVLEAVTGRETASFVDEQGAGHKMTVEPAANYFVARARRQVRGGRMRFGAIATAMNRDPEGTVLESELHTGAYAGGVDFALDSDDRIWLFTAAAAASYVTGDPLAILATQRASRRYFQRPDAAHVELDPSAESLSGYYLMGYVGKQAGNFTMRNGVGFISPGFESNDLGFHNNADRVLLDTHYQWSEREPGRFLRSWSVAGSPDAVWNFAGDRTFVNFNTMLNLEFLNYWRGSWRLQWDPYTNDDRLTRGGPMARGPRRFDARLNLNSDGRRAMTVGANVGWGHDTEGSWTRNLGANVNVRLDETVQFRFGPSYSWSHADVQYISRIGDPLAEATYGARYVFAPLDRTQLSFETNLNVTVSPTMSLQVYLEPFISTGDYGALKEFATPNTYEFNEYGTEIGTVTQGEDGAYLIDPDAAGPADDFRVSDRDFSFRSLIGNAVFRWEWRPGSTVFLVWQQRRVNSVTGQVDAGGTWVGDFDFSRDTDDMFFVKPDNILMIKVNYWLNP